MEAAKPREFRDINRVVNSVNPGVIKEEDLYKAKRPRCAWGGVQALERRSAVLRPVCVAYKAKRFMCAWGACKRMR